MELYAKAFELLADRKELLKMLADFAFEEDIFASLRKTNESRARILEKELKEAKEDILERDAEIRKRDVEIQDRDSRIRELEAQLALFEKK